MDDLSFQTYKTVGLIASLAAVLLVQTMYPHKNDARSVIKNSYINFSLASVNFFLLSLICIGCICSLAISIEDKGHGLSNWLGLSIWTRIFLTVFILDFVAFAWHWANHKIGFLLRFHSVHHSDRVFDASTAFRFHPGELIISLGVRLLAVSMFGLPVAGILLFEIIYGFFNILEHGNIRCGKRFEEFASLIFITPALHRKHHSNNALELNRNFGTVFSIWDRLFRQFLASHSTEKIEVGLPGKSETDLRVRDLLAYPIFQP